MSYKWNNFKVWLKDYWFVMLYLSLVVVWGIGFCAMIHRSPSAEELCRRGGSEIRSLFDAAKNGWQGE